SGLLSPIGSELASILAIRLASELAAALDSDLTSDLASDLASDLGSDLASDLATLLGSARSPEEASAIIGPVRFVAACAILSSISSRMRASRLPALLPPMTTATR